MKYIVLKPIARPSAEQIRVFRELNLLGRTYSNMLEIRRILIQGGDACFGEMLEDRAKHVSSRLSAVGIPHEIGETPIRKIIFPKGTGK